MLKGGSGRRETHPYGRATDIFTSLHDFPTGYLLIGYERDGLWNLAKGVEREVFMLGVVLHATGNYAHFTFVSLEAKAIYSKGGL